MLWFFPRVHKWLCSLCLKIFLPIRAFSVENINIALCNRIPVNPTIYSCCIATKTHHTHTTAHHATRPRRLPLPHTRRVVYHWVFVEQLHFPSEQQWSPAVTPVRHLPRILATAYRSEGGQPVLLDAMQFDPAYRGHSPAKTNTPKRNPFIMQLWLLRRVQFYLKSEALVIIKPVLEVLWLHTSGQIIFFKTVSSVADSDKKSPTFCQLVFPPELTIYNRRDVPLRVFHYSNKQLIKVWSL